MRKFSLFLIMFTFILTASACGNTSGGNDEKGTANQASSDKVSSMAPGDNNSSKPEFLTMETFKDKIWDFEKNPQEWVYEGNEPAIIDFYADWCKPCKMVAPILDEISKDYQGKIKVYKIDTQKERELAQIFQISSIPAFLYIPKTGKPQMDVGYRDKAAFEQIIKDILMK